MYAIKKLFLFLIALAVIVVCLLFSLENQQRLSLTFAGWSAPSFPASIYILAAFLFGLVLGPLFTVITVRRSHRSLRK